MKTTIYFSLLLLCVPLCAQPKPTARAKFNWKLRLGPRQRWTQRLQSRIQSGTSVLDPRTGKTMRVQTNISQNIIMSNEVVGQTRGFTRVRTTYKAFDQKITTTLNGKSLPQPAMLNVSKAFVGGSFSMKIAPDGHVSEVSGLENLVARENRYLASVAKTPAERAALKRSLPTAAVLRATIIKSQSVALPKSPLAVGQSYLYAVALPTSLPVPVSANGKRTLRAFDGKIATFADGGTFSVAPTKPISAGGSRVYMAMRGTISGRTLVNAQSGLVNSSRISVRLSGKVTAVDGGGRRTAVPVDATVQTTLTTTK